MAFNKHLVSNSLIVRFNARSLLKHVGMFCLVGACHVNQAQAIQTNAMGIELEPIAEDVDSALTADPIESFINANPDDLDYAASNSDEDLWARIRDGYSMPNIDSEYTAKYEAWYAKRPDYVARMLERSQKYLFHIVEEVEKRGMPTEIALLPMIESAYNPQAYSRSHASGIWQFVPATGKDYGLKQNYWIDKRRDVTAATNAALTYLQKLHGMFGSWDLALAAYNAGEGTVSRAIERNRKQGLATDYQSLNLPVETKNYVPKLQAIKNIIFKPNEYGLKLVEIPNRPYFTNVIAPAQIDATLAAKLAEISDEEFTALNPSYNRPVIVSNNEVHQLLLPTWAAEKFKENLANYDKPLTSWQPYSAKRGERIDYIAQKFNINAKELRAVNNLSAGNKIRVSRPILVPTGLDNANESNLMLADFKVVDHKNAQEADEKPAKTLTYKVKRGDTLSSLANKFNLSHQQILRSNGLTSSTLKAGQLIKITSNGVASSAKAKSSKRFKSTTRTKRHAKHSTSYRKKSTQSHHRRPRM